MPTEPLGAALGREIAAELGLSRRRDIVSASRPGRPGLRKTKAKPFYTIKIPAEDLALVEELRLEILAHGTSALGADAAQHLVHGHYVTLGLGPVIGFAARMTLERLRRRTGT